MVDTILLPLEGSDGIDWGIERAVELGDEHDATVHAVHVVDAQRYGTPALSTNEVLIGRQEDEGHELLNEFAARAAERGVDAETRCCRGDCREAVVEYAAEIDADAAVIGHWDRTYQTRRSLEEVVDRVIDGRTVTA